MRLTIAEIAEALGAVPLGDGSVTVTGASEPADATPEHLAIAMTPAYAARLPEGRARAALVWDGADWQDMGLAAALVMPRPRYALSGVTRLLDPGPEVAPGIHPSAVIDETAQIGPGARIGPHVVIGRGARIGANARIAPLVTISEEAAVGDDALIHARAHIGARVRIGNAVFIQPGAVIGSDGFSFVTPERSAVENVRQTLGDRGAAGEQSWTRIHSLGAVEIGDDVEIGANACIDRGTIRSTRVGSGTKIDNLVHIGHNVVVGDDCLLCGQVGIAGSSVIGDRVVMAGQVGVNDNITVGDDVVAGGATKIFTNVPKGRVILGNPATKMDTQIEIQKATRRLPRLARMVSELQKAVSNREASD